MCIILAIFAWLKNNASSSLMEFPPNLNCAGMAKLFESKEDFKSFAEYDKQPTLMSKGTGIY